MLKGYLSLLPTNLGPYEGPGVHVPWTCDHGLQSVDGLAKLEECGFVESGI